MPPGSREHRGCRDPHDDAEGSTDPFEADQTAHQHEQRRGRDDVHERGGKRNAPDTQAVERGVEQRVESDRTDCDARRHPVRLHGVEAPVEDQHPAVEDEADRERHQALRDDRRVLGRELAALVDEPHDRCGEHDRHQARRDQEERDLAEPRVERAPQTRVVAPCGEAGERRKEDGRHGDGEHALRQHVQAERLVDGRRSELGVQQPRCEQRVDQEVHVDEADRQRDREHQDEHAADRRVAPVEHHRQAPVEPPQPWDRKQELDDRPEDDDARIEIELRVLARDPRYAEDETEDDHEVPCDRRERRQREVVVGVEDPDDDPRQAEENDDREQHAREPDCEVEVPAGIPERPHEERREQDEDRGQAAEDQESQPEERRGDAPRALALTTLEQLAEDRDERARQRGIGDERTDEIRDLDRDRERVDLPADAEEVRGDHLSYEAEDTRDGRRDREHRRRSSDPTTMALLGVERGIGGLG